MAGYQPMKITGMTTGLVQDRENFLLPNDAYPTLENAFVWRERIKRKKGTEILGRLQLAFSGLAIGNFPVAVPPPPFTSITFVGNLFTIAGVVVDPDKTVAIGSVSMTSFGAYTWQDSNLDGRLITTTSSGSGYNEVITNITIGAITTIFINAANSLVPGDIVYISGISGTTELNNNYFAVATSAVGSFTINAATTNAYTGGGRVQMSPGFVNYLTGDFILTVNNGFQGVAISAGAFAYNPNLPVMGLKSRELNSINNEETIAFDQKYAYKYNFASNSWEEFLPGTTWNGDDSSFFWSTNYWVTPAAEKLFWVTNFNITGATKDPIRFTNGATGTNWVNFSPTIDASANLLTQCLCLLPFRGRLVAFNTYEGTALNNSVQKPQRIRWAAIGNPISDINALFPLAANVNANAWRDDIRGQGGFLDIPTSESIVSVGFVRDNLVIYCERSTWQLRYTGRSIAPFQIEKVNSELGSESTFSAVQFDTSLVGIGDKGIVECDSFKSERIDIKIPDLVFQFNNEDEGTKRVHGIRDFAQRLAYWTYPYAPNDSQEVRNKFPDKRLVYNYENDSWAIFDDSFTCFGNFQPQNSLTWSSVNGAWKDQNYPWINRPALFPSIIAGNQQGYVHYIDTDVNNDVSLYIKNVTGNTPNPTVINSVDHNLLTGTIVEISLPGAQPFSNLDGQRFSIVRVDEDNFQLWTYNPASGQFNIPQTDAVASYIGGGQVIVVDNFRVVSKKFSFIDEGQNIQLGYIDILMNNTENGAISLNVYLDYNDNNPINIPPDNAFPVTLLPDTFFNSVVPTSVTVDRGSSKNWQRVFCPSRGSFITIEWTLSNEQMVGVEQGNDVQIDAQILWVRKAGKQLPIGV